MKKSNLKTGMIVEERNDRKMVVLLNTEYGDILRDTTSNIYGNLESYNENLLHNNQNELDIMKIHSSAYECECLNYGTYNIIWERKEIKPIKFAEAFKGYNQERLIMSLSTKRKFHICGKFGSLFLNWATSGEIDGDWCYANQITKFR